MVGSKKDSERVDFEYFLPIYAKISEGPGVVAEQFLQGLRNFDRDGKGTIAYGDLKHLMTSVGEKLSDKEAEELLSAFKDDKGNVNYENFVKTMSKPA